MFDIQGQITRCFIFLMQGMFGQAKQLIGVQGLDHNNEDAHEPLVIIA